MPRQFLVTAALPYANGKPHVGHIAGAYLPADIYVRYLRCRGEQVLFICGSDDNGAAIELAAIKEKTTPEAIVAKYHPMQKAAFDGLGIHFDVYGGTHHPDFVERHNRLSQEFFKSIEAKGYFRKVSTRQFYDIAVDKFLPDRYVEGTCPLCGHTKARGDECENCQGNYDVLSLKEPRSVLSGSVPEIRETVHWHLRLNAFEQPLREWLETKRDWRPTVLNFALGQIREGLPERAMTRDLAWGVPVPLEDPDAQGKVLFVWFDAPIGYVSFTAALLEARGEPASSYSQWWKNPETKIIHFIGEDNIVFHALIWPAMLMAEGSFQLPTQVVANSFLNLGDDKMSKGRGTAVWIDEYLETGDPDPLRYYLTAIAPENARTSYQPLEIVERNDNELVAALGNFINRVVKFAHQYFDGKVPEVGERQSIDIDHLGERVVFAERIAAHMEGYRFKAALGEFMALARAGNYYLDQKKPWTQRKTDMAACGTSVNVALQTVKALTILMEPFLPFSAATCRKMLRLGDTAPAWSSIESELTAGYQLDEPVALFKKLAEPTGKA